MTEKPIRLLPERGCFIQRDCHYYATLALAVQAGYSPEESKIIAFANYQCDCTALTQVKWWNFYYSDVGPFFHFLVGDEILGDIEAVQPNTPLLRSLVLSANSPIALGIALHTFMDSYSHAGFVGRWDKRNVVSLGRSWLGRYGHTQMLRRPDRAEVVWTDTRTGEIRQNHNIFREALASTAGLLKVNIRMEQIHDILAVTRIPKYDTRKKEWATLAGMPEIRFSQIRAEMWKSHKKEFKAAAKRQREFLR